MENLKGIDGMRNEMGVLKRLRDILVEDNRRAEATLLVSSIWRALGDQRIFEGFEGTLFHILEDLLLKGGESKALAKIILENPEWLMKQTGGVLLFLYICHIGDFPDLVERVRFQFFSDFEEAREKYPILVDDFFLKTRFPENPLQQMTEVLSDAERILARQTIKEIDHDLLKASCYKSWLPAADYQIIFNRKIDDLRQKILGCAEAQAIEIEREIRSIEPRRWIMEADRILRNKVRHPARELMEKYITEQTTRLEGLIAIKRKIGSEHLISYLEGRSNPLKDRLMKERKAQINPPEEVARVYRKVSEGVR